MTLWRWIRNRSVVLDSLRDLREQVSLLQVQLDGEVGKRIAAEALAFERKGEVEWLREDRVILQGQLAKLSEERLKSLDTLNLKLMESRVEAPPPDMSQFNPVEKLKRQIVNDMRAASRALDTAVLEKLHPRFARHPVNEPLLPEETSPQAAD